MSEETKGKHYVMDLVKYLTAKVESQEREIAVLRHELEKAKEIRGKLLDTTRNESDFYR